MTKKQKMKTVLLAVLIVGTMIMVGAASSQQIFAFKLTSKSHEDGYNKGYSDAVCDSNNCHGHGYDPTVQEDIQMFSVAAIHQDIRLDGVGDQEEINSLVTQIAITITIITNKEQETP